MNSLNELSNIELLNADFFEPYILPIVIIFILMILDLITGITKALLSKTFCSSKLRSGLDKYRSYITVTLVSIIIDIMISFFFDDCCNTIAVFCIIFMCICEIVSIIENCTNIKIPPMLTNTINLLRSLWSKENRK